MKLLSKLLLTILLIVTTIYASEQAPTQAEVSKLYVATFNRAPDSAGLSYWVNNSGLTLSGIARSFFVQPETQALYPKGTTVKAFIQSVYQNLFNRAPKSAGLSYWEDDFNLRGRTRDSFILAMINGAQDNANGMDKTILNNKNEVGLYFANKGLGADDYPTVVMSGVTSSSDTVAFIEGKIDSDPITANIWSEYTQSGGGSSNGDDSSLNSNKSIFIFNNAAPSVRETQHEIGFGKTKMYESNTPLHCTNYGYSNLFLEDIHKGIHSLSYWSDDMQNMCLELDYANATQNSGSTNVALYE